MTDQNLKVKCLYDKLKCMETPVQAHVTYLFSKFRLIVEEKHEIVVYNNAFRNDAIMPFSFLTKISVKLNHKNYVLS